MSYKHRELGSWVLDCRGRGGEKLTTGEMVRAEISVRKPSSLIFQTFYLRLAVYCKWPLTSGFNCGYYDVEFPFDEVIRKWK